jgi:hypothetical protein
MWKLACCLLFAAAVAAAPIRWEPFELPQGAPKLKAELGRLTIPLNRKRPESGPAEIAFVRLRAGDGAAGAPIVYVAGGPGDSGINAARNPYALPSLARLAATGDVILLDQRGIGMSSPRPMCAAPPVEPEERFVSESVYLERFLRLTRACVERIGRLNGELNAFISFDEGKALAAARRADEVRGRGEAGPLTGIPIAHKDIFCTAGIRTTCGSRMLENYTSPYDAHVVEQLERAGMPLVGKLNMDEFAMGSSNENSYFGPVRNPWDRRVVPGGSSGGSAAAVAARMVPAATGSVGRNTPRSGRELKSTPGAKRRC